MTGKVMVFHARNEPPERRLSDPMRFARRADAPQNGSIPIYESSFAASAFWPAAFASSLAKTSTGSPPGAS